MRQPRNVMSLLAVISLVAGLLSLFAGTVLMFGGGLSAATGVPAGITVMMLGAIMFALGPAHFVLGFGFWTARPWAWSVAFGVYGVSILVDIFSVVVGASPGAVAVSVALAVVVLVYLRRPDVRVQFARPQAPTPVPAKA